MSKIGNIFGTAKYKVSNDAINNPFSKRLTEMALNQAQIGQNERATQFNQSQQARTQQQSLANALNNQMSGEGPTLAQQQLNQGRNQNVASTAGQAAANRSVNPALAARLQANTAAKLNQQASADSAALRAAEQQSAQNSLGVLTSNIRGQDQAGTQAAGSFTTDQQQIAGQQSETDRAARLSREQIQAGGHASAMAARGNMVSNIGTGIAAAFSDENNKKNINMENDDLVKEEAPADGKSRIRSFIDAVAIKPKPNAPAAASNSIGSGQYAGIADAITAAASAFSDEDNKKNINMANGGLVKGEAPVEGDHPDNDIVDATLSPGEIVVPRTIAEQSPEVILNWIKALKMKGGDTKIDFTPSKKA